MKRRLLIMRHAKSSWNNEDLSDHQRPLNKRGRKDATRMGEELVALDLVPEIIISSDSQRTTETYSLLVEALGESIPEIDTTRAFYGGNADDISDALDDVSDHISTIMVLGHNPGWTQAVGYFSDEYVEMTTANIAVLECDAETWAKASARGKFTLKSVLRPKELD